MRTTAATPIEEKQTMSNEELLSTITKGNLDEHTAAELAALAEERFPSPEELWQE